MQEKLQEILQSAKGWLTAAEIAELGGWRSPQHVGLALKQMSDVEHRSAPVKKMFNGMPAKEYKPSYRVFEGDPKPAAKEPAPVVRSEGDEA